MHDLTELKHKVLHSEDKNELMECQIELTECLSEYHSIKARYELDNSPEYAMVELKGKIALCYSISQICKTRIDDWRDTEGKSNYHFRMAAKVVLPKEIYNSIFELTKLSREYVRDNKDEIKKEFKQNFPELYPNGAY